MKRNLLLFSLMVICSNLIFAMPLDTRKQIKMKVRVKIEHRSANLPSPVQVCISNSCLRIEFRQPSHNVTLSITDTATGETIYHEKIISLQEFKSISLSELKENTEYILKISSLFWDATGIFTIN